MTPTTRLYLPCSRALHRASFVDVQLVDQGTEARLSGMSKGQDRIEAGGEDAAVNSTGETALYISSVQFSSVDQSCSTLCNHMNHSTPGLLVHHQPRSSLRLTSIKSVMPSSHLILCHPLLLLLSIPPSIRVFSNESTLRIRWPKY